MSRRTLYVAAILLSLAPFVYLAAIWQRLPATVPVHFGIDGKPDDFGNKSELMLGTSIIAAIGFGVFLLLMNVQKIDPKKAQNSPRLMAKLGFSVLILLSFIQFMIIDSARTGTIHLDKFLLPVMGLFFAFLGNIFYSVKPNYFVGIRTPWALENEDNWRRTHQLAGKLWFAGGLAAALLTLFTPFVIAVFIFMGITLVMVVIPFIYSYKIFKKSQLRNSSL